MRGYLMQYEEAKKRGYFDKEGNVILINSCGFPLLPTFWLKVEFVTINLLSKLKKII